METTDDTNPLRTMGNTLLRSAETFKTYHDNPKRDPSLECFICSAAPSRIFPYWKIIKNDFPYDAVASIHEMLVPIRHVARDTGLSAEEFAALDIIKRVLNKERTHDAIIENLDRGRTVPGHFHYHLMQWIRAPREES